MSGTTDNLDFNNLANDIRNPTYEYYPPKTDGVWPRDLQILKWAYPFVLYPLAAQLPSGGLFLFVSNASVIINTDTDEISTKVPDLIVPEHMPWIYPYSPTMVMLPLTKKNGYKATLMVCGGSYKEPVKGDIVSSGTCRKISPDDEDPKWVAEEDMPIGRVMIDSAILPGKLSF